MARLVEGVGREIDVPGVAVETSIQTANLAELVVTATQSSPGKWEIMANDTQIKRNRYFIENHF
jgi:hypothetical protein